MTAVDSVALLVAIEAGASTLIEEAAHLAAANDLAGLAALFAAVRQARATLAFVDSEIETAVAGLMPAATVAVDRVGVLERRGGKKRTAWDHTRLASVLAARVGDRRFDPATGEELARPPAVLAQDVADEIMTCAGVSYWKVGELRARKVDPTQFCEEEPGRTTVGIRPNA